MTMPNGEQPEMYELTFKGPPVVALPWSWTLNLANERGPEGQKVWLFDVSVGNAGVRVIADAIMLRPLADAIIKASAGIEVVRPGSTPPIPRMTDGPS